MESNIIIQKQEKCSQNMTPVYKSLSEDVINQNLTEVSFEELRNFLLDDNIFPPSYVDKNRSFISFLEVQKLPFTLESMVKYIEHKKLKKQEIAPATARNRKYQMRRICQELILANPEKWSSVDQFKLDTFFSKLKTGTRQTRGVSKDRILTKEEIERLLQFSPKTWKLIFLFLAMTGVRVSEMISIIRRRCVVNKSEVSITFTGKGNKQRKIVIPKELYDSICKTFPSRYYLFSTKRGTPFDRRHIWRGCNRIGQSILGRPIGVHIFRHSLATQLIESGVELKKVSDYLGHSDTTITNDMYVHLDVLSLDEIPVFKESLNESDV